MYTLIDKFLTQSHHVKIRPSSIRLLFVCRENVTSVSNGWQRWATKAFAHTECRGESGLTSKPIHQTQTINPNPHPAQYKLMENSIITITQKDKQSKDTSSFFPVSYEEPPKEHPHNSRYATIARPKCIQFPNAKIAPLTFKPRHHTG